MDEKKFKTPWRNVPFEEMPNHKFGRLTAKRLVVDGIKKVRKWECECECGNVIVVLETTLIKGKKHCGCGNPLKRNWKELEGKKFGKLTVLKYQGKDSEGHPSALCQCECGEATVVRCNNLESGNSKSCGCGRISEAKNLNECKIIDGVAYLKTTDGQEFLVDEEDLPKLCGYTWCKLQNKYLVANIKGTVTRLHRLILNPPEDMVVDHINGNGFDNRKCNLRICKQIGNSRNCKLGKNNRTGYVGVEACKDGKFSANIVVEDKHKFLGYYNTFDEAKAARIAAEQKYFGDYAPSVGALRHLVGG